MTNSPGYSDALYPCYIQLCLNRLWLREKAETTGEGALSLLGEGFPGTSNWDGTPITYKSPLT